MEKQEKKFEWVTVRALPESEVELEGELSADEFASYRSRAIEKLKEEFTLPGFRKGRVPEDIFIKNVGEAAILEEAAHLALNALYPQIILEKELDVVGPPSITITKLALGNPFGFKAKTAVMPKVELPDYRKIAAEVLVKYAKETAEVTDKEFDEFLTAIRTQYAQAGGEKEAPLPELNDEFVRKLGPFQTVDEFRQKARERMVEDKARRLSEKKRLAIADAIIEKTNIELPPLFIESELHKMMAQFEHDIERMGLKIEEYLKQIGKTPADLEKEWKPEAAKRASLQLVLNAIAEKESVKADLEELKREVEHVLEHRKDADRERVHIYIESMMRNERVFRLLEGN